MSGKGYKVYTTPDFIRKNHEGELDYPRSLQLVQELSEAASHHRDSNILVDLT